jgi:general secretion pathway protein A
MYNQFFALRENPFNVNPDPRYLFLTRQTKEAFDGLTHGIQARKGLLLLTGEVGTGKTTLLNHLLDWLHQQRTPTAFIFNSHLEISQLFDFVLTGFGVRFDSRLKDNALMRLHHWLWERYRAGETPVVIVDEAQGLPNRVLEEIRMLLNLETFTEKLLQIVLAGQPELEARLEQPQLRQVKQRIALRCKTAALSLEEAHRYVQARLYIAGAGGARIFAPEAMDAVHFYSRGIPRIMNLLCEHALINASAKQIQPVPARFVAEIASEFQFDDFRPVARSSDSADGLGSSGIPVRSRFTHALVALTAAGEPVSQDYPGPSANRAAGWSTAADNVVSPVKEPAAPVLDCENLTDDGVAAAPSALSSAQLAAPAAPWLKQLEARLLSDWTVFFSEVGGSLAAELTEQPAPLTHSPRLHLVEAKPALGVSPVSSRCQVPSPQKLAPPSLKAAATKSLALRSALMKTIALRFVLVSWGTELSRGFLSIFTSPAWTRATTTLFQLRGPWLLTVGVWCKQYLAWGDRCLTCVGSIDCAHLKMTTTRWLRQPCDPTQWRLLDSRLFEGMFRFNNKKM